MLRTLCCPLSLPVVSRTQLLPHTPLVDAWPTGEPPQGKCPRSSSLGLQNRADRAMALVEDRVGCGSCISTCQDPQSLDPSAWRCGRMKCSVPFSCLLSPALKGSVPCPFPGKRRPLLRSLSVVSAWAHSPAYSTFSFPWAAGRMASASVP